MQGDLVAVLELTPHHVKIVPASTQTVTTASMGHIRLDQPMAIAYSDAHCKITVAGSIFHASTVVAATVKEDLPHAEGLTSDQKT